MAGIRGKSGPPGNQNAFRHGLAAVHNRRADDELTERKRDIRTEILAGLIADNGGEAQINTATRISAEIISGNVALLVTFNQSGTAGLRIVVISRVTKQRQRAGLIQLDRERRIYN